MHRLVSIFRLACGLLLGALPCLAQDAPGKRTTATAGLGYVSTAGNSEIQTITASDKLESRFGEWKLSQDGDAVWGSDNGTENVGRYLLGLRVDRELGEHLAVYALTSWRRNVFAGVSRQFDEGVGLAWHLLASRPQALDLEAGVGLAQRRSTQPANEDFGTGRLGVLYRHPFQEKSHFESGGRYLHNFKDSSDYEWAAKAALVSSVSSNLAVKLSYDYAFRNTPPAGFEQWESTLGAGIQLNW